MKVTDRMYVCMYVKACVVTRSRLASVLRRLMRWPKHQLTSVELSEHGAIELRAKTDLLGNVRHRQNGVRSVPVAALLRRVEHAAVQEAPDAAPFKSFPKRVAICAYWHVASPDLLRASLAYLRLRGTARLQARLDIKKYDHRK